LCTAKVLLPLMVPAVAVTVELSAAPPAAIAAPVANPLALIVAPLLAAHATCELMSCEVPLLNVPIALNWAVLPVVMLGVDVLTVIDVRPGMA
jgi:hypothetical protein